jgi:hypothetical protein
MQQVLDQVLNDKDTLMVCGRGMLGVFQQIVFELFDGKNQFILHLSQEINAPLNRAPLYLRGGIITFSSTAVLLDLLNGVFPIDKLSGVLITDAHT